MSPDDWVIWHNCYKISSSRSEIEKTTDELEDICADLQAAGLHDSVILIISSKFGSLPTRTIAEQSTLPRTDTPSPPCPMSDAFISVVVQASGRANRFWNFVAKTVVAALADLNALKQQVFHPIKRIAGIRRKLSFFRHECCILRCLLESHCNYFIHTARKRNDDTHMLLAAVNWHFYGDWV